MKTYSIAMVAACPFPANHGSPASIRGMSEGLTRLGHTIHIVTYPFGQDLPVDERIHIHRVRSVKRSYEIRVGPTIEKPLLDLLLLIRLCRVIRREKIHLIHAHNYEGGLIGIIARWITGVPLLYNAVNTMADELPGYRFIRPAALARGLARLLDRFVPSFPDHITVVSEALGEFLVRQGIQPERISLVPAGIESEMFIKGNPARFKQKYGIGGGPLILYTGTLDPFQRVDYLIRAFASVAREVPDARLMVLNNIVQEDQLGEHRRTASALDIGDRVIWAGPHALEELPDYLAMADVTVIPRPDCPGHPVKLLNYMAAGKPIVSSAGSAKGLRHRHDALVVPDHDCDGMAKAMILLLRDRELAEALGRNARNTVMAHFDWDILTKGIEVLYEGIVEKNGRIDCERFQSIVKQPV
jgi:glycosyltransferase involved in cell wall biosynthesis